MNDVIIRKLEQAMSVEELIEELQRMPSKARVVFACDYGDRGNTQQALQVTEVLNGKDEWLELNEKNMTKEDLQKLAEGVAYWIDRSDMALRHTITVAEDAKGLFADIRGMVDILSRVTNKQRSIGHAKEQSRKEPDNR